MTARIYTAQGCINIGIKLDNIEEHKELISKAIENNETLVLTTTEDTQIYINTLNVVALEFITE